MIDIRVDRSRVELREIEGSGGTIVTELMCAVKAIYEITKADGGADVAEGFLEVLEDMYKGTKDAIIQTPPDQIVDERNIFNGSAGDFLNG